MVLINPDEIMEEDILRRTKAAGRDLTMAQLLAELELDSSRHRATVKAMVIRLVGTDRLILTDDLKIRFPVPPAPDPRPRATLAKLLKDKTMKMVLDRESAGIVYKTFESKPRDLPRAVRVDIIRFVLHQDTSKDRVYRSKRETQKFLAIGGPYDCEWLLDGEVEGYVRFNCATGSSRRRDCRAPKRPTAVLVHEAVLV
jgi:hypothetical protein